MSNSLDPNQVHLFGLIWVQTVCKGYQQKTLVNKKLMKKGEFSNLCRYPSKLHLRKPRVLSPLRSLRNEVDLVPLACEKPADLDLNTVFNRVLSGFKLFSKEFIHAQLKYNISI